jgi:hypothetical protein
MVEITKRKKQQTANTLSFVQRSLVALSSVKSPDFVVLKARLLPCISKIEYEKQELSFRQ